MKILIAGFQRKAYELTKNELELNDKVYNKIVSKCEKGDKLIEKLDFEKAIKIYTEALDLIPIPKNIWEASTWVYTQLGDVYF